MDELLPKITIEIQMEDVMGIIKVKNKMTKTALQWSQSPSKDVIQYRLYIERGDKLPTYDSPFCTIAKPPGNKPKIKYNLSECFHFFGYSGDATVAVAAVDEVGNISDFTSPVKLII